MITLIAALLLSPQSHGQAEELEIVSLGYSRFSPMQSIEHQTVCDGRPISIRVLGEQGITVTLSGRPRVFPDAKYVAFASGHWPKTINVECGSDDHWQITFFRLDVDESQTTITGHRHALVLDRDGEVLFDGPVDHATGAVLADWMD